MTLYDSGHSLDDFGYAMALLADGSVLVGGQSGGDLALGKFDASGNPVTAFGGDGIVTVDLGGTEQIRGLIAQSDGSIVVGGLKGNDFAIAKLTSAGVLDSTFGTSSGYTATDFSSSIDAGYAIARQADGKFVVAGASGTDFGVARYTTGGILDTTFNTTGKVTTNISGTDVAYAVTIGPDYKITAVGYSGTAGTPSTDDFAIARYRVASGLEERLYAQTDVNHNVTSISDVFGSVKERFIYDPYRQSTALTSAWASTSDGYSWVIRSQGEREDSTTNTIDGRARIYGIGLGRWFQADSAGYIDGVSRYQLEASNPAYILDPSGLVGRTPTAATKPVSTTSPSLPPFDDLFPKDERHPSALITLNDVLLGKADKLPDSLELPTPLEVAMARAAENTRRTGNEWGGVVTESGESFRVWAPVEGERGRVTGPELTSADPNPDRIIGIYHTHPHSPTFFSRGDVIQFLEGHFSFSAMTDCDNSEVHLLVAMPTTVRRFEKGYTGTEVWSGPAGNQKLTNADELMQELAALANKNKFGFYYRKGKSGPLHLVKLVTKDKK